MSNPADELAEAARGLLLDWYTRKESHKIPNSVDPRMSALRAKLAAHDATKALREAEAKFLTRYHSWMQSETDAMDKERLRLVEEAYEELLLVFMAGEPRAGKARRCNCRDPECDGYGVSDS